MARIGEAFPLSGYIITTHSCTAEHQEQCVNEEASHQAGSTVYNFDLLWDVSETTKNCFNVGVHAAIASDII